MEKSKVFPSCSKRKVHVLLGYPRNLHYCHRPMNRGEKYAEWARTGAQQGLGPSLRVPPARPAERGFRGRIWVAGSSGWEAVTCLRESRLLPASWSRPGRGRGARCCSLPSPGRRRAASGFVTPAAAAAAAQAHPGKRRRSRSIHFVSGERPWRSLDFLKYET